jgi:hypothetical protein
MLFGQRFVIGPYITGNVVSDKIKYHGDFVCGSFPSTVNVLAGQRDNASIKLLVPELNQYHYFSNLAAVRYFSNGSIWKGGYQLITA